MCFAYNGRLQQKIVLRYRWSTHAINDWTAHDTFDAEIPEVEG